MAMRVMVVKYGYTVIDTDNEEDAIESAEEKKSILIMDWIHIENQRT